MSTFSQRVKMEKQELCTAGALLAQRLDIGIKNLQEGTAGVKVACDEVVKTLQDIRNTTTGLHTRLLNVESRADKNDKKTSDLGEKFEGHIGRHVGTERAGVAAGRRHGMIYGFTSAAVGSVIAMLSAWKFFLIGS